MISSYWPYLEPEKRGKANNDERKQKLIVDALRFVKRMTNIDALPGSDTYNLGSGLIKKIVNLGIFEQLIDCLKYGIVKEEKEIIQEASKAIWNVVKYGKMTLRYGLSHFLSLEVNIEIQKS